MNHYPRDPQIEDNKPSNNKLPKTKHTKSNILSTGLNQIKCQHPILQIGLKGPKTCLDRYFLITQHSIKKKPQRKSSLKSTENVSYQNPYQRLIDPICLSLVVAKSRFTHVHCCYNDKSVSSCKLTVNNKTTLFIKKG